MVDLVFVVTSSNSVGFRDWSNIISFVNAIAGTLDINSGLARVGLVKLVRFIVSFPDCFFRLIHCKLAVFIRIILLCDDII